MCIPRLLINNLPFVPFFDQLLELSSLRPGDAPYQVPIFEGVERRHLVCAKFLAYMVCRVRVVIIEPGIGVFFDHLLYKRRDGLACIPTSTADIWVIAMLLLRTLTTPGLD